MTTLYWSIWCGFASFVSFLIGVHWQKRHALKERWAADECLEHCSICHALDKRFYLHENWIQGAAGALVHPRCIPGTRWDRRRKAKKGE